MHFTQIVAVVVSGLGLTGGGVAVMVSALRNWCVFRREGKVRFHRRVNREHLKALEVELEIGPNGKDAMLERLAAEHEADERVLRMERRRKDMVTGDDLLKTIAAVYSVPGPMYGRRKIVNERAWYAFKNGHGFVLPPGFKIDELGLDGESLYVMREPVASRAVPGRIIEGPMPVSGGTFGVGGPVGATIPHPEQFLRYLNQQLNQHQGRVEAWAQRSIDPPHPSSY